MDQEGTRIRAQGTPWRRTPRWAFGILIWCFSTACSTRQFTADDLDRLSVFGGSGSIHLWGSTDDDDVLFSFIQRGVNSELSCNGEVQTGIVKDLSLSTANGSVLLGQRLGDTGTPGVPGRRKVNETYILKQGTLELDIEPDDGWDPDAYWDWDGINCAVAQARLTDLVFEEQAGGHQVEIASYSFPPIGVGGIQE